jgi:hypothetical protein
MGEGGSVTREVRATQATSAHGRHAVRGYLSIMAAALCWGAAATLGRAVLALVAEAHHGDTESRRR